MAKRTNRKLMALKFAQTLEERDEQIGREENGNHENEADVRSQRLYSEELRRKQLSLFKEHLKKLNEKEMKRVSDQIERLINLKSKRLENFVDVIYDYARIDYTNPEVKEHVEYIETYVTDISEKLGEKFPVFKVAKIIPTEGYSDKTIVRRPDYVRLCLVFVLSYDKTKVGVLDTQKEHYRTNSGQINIKDPFVSKELSELAKKYAIKKELLSPTIEKGEECMALSIDIVEILQKAIGECTRMLSKDVDVTNNGPNIRLSIKAPFCDTIVDLSFCFEESNTGNGRCVVVPKVPKSTSMDSKMKCSLGDAPIDCHWSLEMCDHPLESKRRLPEEDPHVKLLVVLKFLSHPPLDYRILKTLIMQHILSCSEGHATLGTCLRGIIQELYTDYYFFFICKHKQVAPRTPYYDIDFPKVGVITSIDKPTMVRLCVVSYLIETVWKREDWKDVVFTEPFWFDYTTLHKDERLSRKTIMRDVQEIVMDELKHLIGTRNHE